MKKHTYIRWIALGIFLAALVIFVGKCISLYPVYPDFKKEVHSYDQIQQALQNHPEICMPDLSDLSLTNEHFSLRLSDRTLFSHPDGYLIVGSNGIHFSVKVRYILDCEKVSRDFSSYEYTYRDIPLKHNRFLTEKNTIFTSNAILFSLGSYAYSFEARYDHSNLTESEIAALDSAIQTSLLELVYPVVDSYLDS